MMKLDKQETAAAYLAAMIDGEGCVGTYRRERPSSRRVVIANTDPDIISACVRCLTTLGICYRLEWRRRGKKGWKDCVHIQILRRDDILKVAHLPIQARRKRDNLAAIVGSYEHIPPDLGLATDFYAAGCTMKEIGGLFGCADTTIRTMFVKAGVPRRPRGTRSHIGHVLVARLG